MHVPVYFLNREVVDDLMSSSSTRKICFHAQKIVRYLVETTHYDNRKGNSCVCCKHINFRPSNVLIAIWISINILFITQPFQRLHCGVEDAGLDIIGLVAFYCQGRVVRRKIKLIQDYREFWFQFFNFSVRFSVYIFFFSLLASTNLKLHKTWPIERLLFKRNWTLYQLLILG